MLRSRPPRVLAALACVAALTGCQAKPKPRAPRVSVTVARVEQRDVPFTLAATGLVEPVATAAVVARVSGTVMRIAFREGDAVRAGQVLLQLDPRPLQATYDQATALWAKDRVQAAAAAAQARRAEALDRQSLGSAADLEQARATADSWAATVRADSAGARAARLDRDYATVRAPITGRTGVLSVHEGDYVAGGAGQPLVTINRVAPVRVRFTVPSSAQALIQQYRHAAPRVYVTLPVESRAREGRLVFVDNAIGGTSGTLVLKGEFPNADGALLPGQYVEVRLQLYIEAGATVVPSVAVTTGQAGEFVYVLQPDSTVVARPVQVARMVDSLAVVGSGVRAGESVVTDGQLRLSPGAKVVVRTPGAPGASKARKHAT